MRPEAVTIVAVLGVLATACSNGDGRSLPPALAPPPPPPTTTAAPTVPAPSLRLVAPWGRGPIDARFGCEPDAAAPPVSWTGVPEGTSELAAVFSIDGVPHDILVGIEPSTADLNEASLPPGAFWWPPSEIDARWSGWCTDSPDADLGLTLYALNQQVEAADETPVTDLVGQITLTAIEQATVTGQLDTSPPT